MWVVYFASYNLYVFAFVFLFVLTTSINEFLQTDLQTEYIIVYCKCDDIQVFKL